MIEKPLKRQNRELLERTKERAFIAGGIALLALSLGRLVDQTYESREDQVVNEAVATAIRHGDTAEEAQQAGRRAEDDFTPTDFVVGNALKDMNKWETFKDLYVRDGKTGDFDKDNATNVAAIAGVVGVGVAAEAVGSGVSLIPSRRKRKRLH